MNFVDVWDYFCHHFGIAAKSRHGRIKHTPQFMLQRMALLLLAISARERRHTFVTNGKLSQPSIPIWRAETMTQPGQKITGQACQTSLRGEKKKPCEASQLKFATSGDWHSSRFFTSIRLTNVRATKRRTAVQQFAGTSFVPLFRQR